VKLFHTDQGVARQEGDQLGLLDISEGDLDTVLANGTLADLHRAAVTRVVPISDVTWLPPVLRPGRFVIAGLNYRAHCEEIGRPIPEKLVFGFAPGAAAHAADSPVIMPAEANTQVDYEGEIGIVIGRTANNVSADAAWSVVAGITTLNDVSARDVQAAGTLEAVGQAKGFPTFKPFGPCLATVDEFDDPMDLPSRRSSQSSAALPRWSRATSSARAHQVVSPTAGRIPTSRTVMWSRSRWTVCFG
jgi:2-keto-4-pentenoate hydratase/2-oxohepta-3-ene-1,7-dioic acid hydratase in catechol pathway